ncbi:MAG: hypothetical protein NVSMB21_18380 [Vulcanimicrobiaceae bacterium]
MPVSPTFARSQALRTGSPCACDLRIGAASARVGVPIARTVGNVTTAANVARLASVVGRAHAIGWPLAARLYARADELARDADALAPRTIAAAKEHARRMRAAASAPVDKRRARFPGR